MFMEIFLISPYNTRLNCFSTLIPQAIFYYKLQMSQISYKLSSIVSISASVVCDNVTSTSKSAVVIFTSL